MPQKKKRLHVDYEGKNYVGFVCMHRGWMDHPAFGTKPLSEREIWAWLIEEATFSYEGREIAFNGSQFMLKRGQLAFAHSFMAEAWGCHKSRVGRILIKFKKFNMIETIKGTDKTLITICNYEEKQIDYRKYGAKNETGKGCKQDDKGTNYNNGKKEKKVKDKDKALRADAHALPLLINVIDDEALDKLKEALEPHLYNAWIVRLSYKSSYIFCEDTVVRDRCKNEYFQPIVNSLRQSSLPFEGFKLVSQS
jgi:hypothetical protein